MLKKGFRKACQSGLLSGHKVAGIKFRLIDGAHHIVDSSDYAFTLAAIGAMKQGIGVFEIGDWNVLEPIMSVEVVAPEEFQGTVLGQLQRRSAIIQGTDSRDSWITIYCEVPLNEMFGYSTEIRSSTQGKGEFSMEYSRYSPAAVNIQQQLLSDYDPSENPCNRMIEL
ncbi:Elongation factor G, mitochondrial [Nymphon striatum]|nr:Elongation factor G, mitochondrial [Nymphon striatum]